jgi:hypothetical protein
MTTEWENFCQAFEYARSKVESGEWSWEQAFEYATRGRAENGEWNWGRAFEWCMQACETFFKKETNA